MATRAGLRHSALGGGRRFEDLVVGVFDLGPSDGENGYDGVLGRDVLGVVPLTADPAGGAIQLGATFLDRYVQTYDVTAAVLTLSPYPSA